MKETIEREKASFLRAKASICRVLATTPDERINWSPSPTARTPIEIVAHAAATVKNLHGILDGHPFRIPNTAEADKTFREWEGEFSTREAVLSLLEANSAAYVAWLDTLTLERLNSLVELPFGMGEAPVAMALTFQAAAMNSHTPQIEYIQTIYGDRDWHME
ncbi:MAG: DinB family protein [Armatimonadota bacterium]|nr:DinB family protein [Armatimonadota bacterium]